MSSIAARKPLSLLVMIVKLDLSTVGCVVLMNFQKWVQLSLSLLPNNMANHSADMVPFAVVAYTEYSVHFPKLMWATSNWMISCLSRTQKSYNQNLLYQEMSTRSGSNLVFCIPIDFYSYTCNNVY
jgi:hypothetical protein